MARRRPYSFLDPLTPQQLSQQAVRYANAQFGPVLAQINAEYNRRAQTGASSIAGGTQQLASALAPVAAQTAGYYSQAKAEQAALDEAMRSGLISAGAAGAADLARQGYAGNQLAGIGAGEGAASFGMGSAALSRLISQGAAAENYAGTLPALARLGGAQHAQDLALQLEHGRQSDVGALQGKIPGTVAQIEQDLANREFQKATARLGFGVDQARLQQQSAYQGARLQQSQQSLNLRAHQQQTDALFKKYGLQLQQANYNLAVQRENRLSRNRSGKRGGFTPSQISDFQAGAIESVKNHKHGIPATYDANGNVKTPEVKGKPRDPVGAFRWLVNHGYPPSIADWAVGSVYGKWKPQPLGKIPGGHGR